MLALHSTPRSPSRHSSAQGAVVSAEGGEGAAVSAVWAEGGGGRGGGGPSSCGIVSPSLSLVQELQSSEGAPLSPRERSGLGGGGGNVSN